MDPGSEVFDEGEREGVADSLEVQRPEVRARPDPTLRFVSQVQAASPVSLSPPFYFFYYPVLQHFFPDPPTFGGLFGVRDHWSPLGFARGVVRGFNFMEYSMTGVFGEGGFK